MGPARPAIVRPQQLTIVLVAVALAVASASTAHAATVVDGGFESSLSGWKAVASTLALRTGAAVEDGYVRASGPTASTYGLQNAQGVATVKGLGYTAGAWARTPKRRAKVCLVLQERNTRRVVGSARTCKTALTTWSSFASLRYTARGTGNRLFVSVVQSSAKATDVLDVDGVLVRDSRDLTAPADVTGLAVTGATGSTISVAWSPASDNVGVAGYGLYLDGRLVTSSTGTAYTFEEPPVRDRVRPRRRRLRQRREPLVRHHDRSPERGVPERAREPGAPVDRGNAGRGPDPDRLARDVDRGADPRLQLAPLRRVGSELQPGVGRLNHVHARCGRRRVDRSRGRDRDQRRRLDRRRVRPDGARGDRTSWPAPRMPVRTGTTQARGASRARSAPPSASSTTSPPGRRVASSPGPTSAMSPSRPAASP